ncbi:hypothetical protein KDJ56_04880 [Brevibacillus composti]|uniref:Uncharacterized protein n=1 Tax=Brevibacillus composti TaxID=2796470 RepID=A0A7T5EME7_9BACL|nr:hypothetical protein [Brevibacillus composti]QQE75324.1 hypothetical protein JD108_05200 [Brevibacillus composti]QUO42350.1 hypothetical protein KDJ56_04880 [Brevibacillus composti]
MDVTTNKGNVTNQEKTIRTREIVDAEKVETQTNPIKSELIRADNADNIYE